MIEGTPALQAHNQCDDSRAVLWSKLSLPLIVATLALPVNGEEALQWSGFALLRGATNAEEAPFYDSEILSQLQVGVDWRPSLLVSGHLHLLARSDPKGSTRGSV